MPRYSFQVITDLAVSTPHPWFRGHCEGTDRSHPLNVGCLDIDQEEVSGARVQRPALAAALRACRAGDMLVVWKLDRLGRNTKHRIEIVEELE